MTPSSSDIAARRRAFRQLHATGCFVIPNPWDAGSARYLQSLGFKALATTSSGLAWSLGQADGDMSRDIVLAHLREMVAATDLPVNADFESGFAPDPQGVAESVRLAIETGVAGPVDRGFDRRRRPTAATTLDVAVARMRAAAPGHRRGRRRHLAGRPRRELPRRPPDLDDTVARLQAYAEAGADCLYAPGIRTREQIATVVAAVAPKPVNLLVGSASDLTRARHRRAGRAARQRRRRAGARGLGRLHARGPRAWRSRAVRWVCGRGVGRGIERPVPRLTRAHRHQDGFLLSP